MRPAGRAASREACSTAKATSRSTTSISRKTGAARHGARGRSVASPAARSTSPKDASGRHIAVAD
eukprot:302458-Lingulodinium_polyedra.AAC.1